MPNLSTAQLAIQQQIIEYGRANGFTDEQVSIAVKAAFIESSLGNNLGPISIPGYTASGLFGYTNGNWDLYHSNLGAKNNIENQINAFYTDIKKYSNWYENPSTSSNIPKDQIDIGEYIYIKHHDGVSYSNFQQAPGLQIWNSIDFVPTLPARKRKISQLDCIASGECISVCPLTAIKEKNGIFEINPDICDGCEDFSSPPCVEACPSEAIVFA